MTTEQTSPRPNSNLALISLISGVLGLTFLPFIGSILAVITASMAKKEIRESEGAMGGEEMAKIGQILGWLGIAFLIIGCCCALILLILIFSAFGFIFNDFYYYGDWFRQGLILTEVLF